MGLGVLLFFMVVGVSAGTYIPVWLGAVGALITISAGLGAAVAVYRTSLQSTSLREAERTMDRLRGEITDYQRREAEMEGDIRVLQEGREHDKARITMLEDLISKRKDDEEIKTKLDSNNALLVQVLDRLPS